MSNLSRRQFLATSSAVALAPFSFAADAEKPSFSFALVTDTHLGKPGADYVKRMTQAVEEINAAAAEFTIFCGDLVDNGQNEANQKLYPQWLDIAKSLKKESRAVPGNHDPAAMFTKHIAKSTENELEFKNWRFLTLADAEPNPGHMGIVTPEQLSWLQDRLKDADKKKQRVVLCAHVIYHENKNPDVGWYIKTGRAEFGKVLEANTHIAAMFGGHCTAECAAGATPSTASTK